MFKTPLPVLAFPLLVLAAAPARANTLTEPTSGLKVDAPAGYVASIHPAPASPRPQVDVKKDSDRDTGCRISYTPIPGNAKLSQDRLNETVRGSTWQDGARKTLSGPYTIVSTDVIDVRGVSTFVVVADFKEKPGPSGERMKQVRTWLAVEETPRGRTSVSCIGERAGFEDRRPEFRAVLDGITVP